MTLRRLPEARVNRTRTASELRAEIPVRALDRWNPGIRAAMDDVDPSISIFDVIGQDFWTGEGVTAKRISAALRSIGDRDVTVNINSPGGDYFEGLAIYNLLRQHQARVTVNVVGLAASAASVIAMAGDEVRIARAGFMMIHNTQWIAIGDRHAMREVADTMEPFDQAAVDIYAARTGLADADIAEMMDAETWMGGRKAVENGFADGLLAADEVIDEDEPEDRAHLTAHRLETLMARMGVPRGERRKMIKDLRGTPRAAGTGTPRAAEADTPRAVREEEAVSDLLVQLRRV
ncbi:ATP-dependent protease ClpP, protease subunit [Filomicrobium insigne]|uniref:ATP-dependent Clp protease proteolytic subunit n=1 Tax=Filomicrobium insigne TaxID=418854 RepID=A0A1H0SEY4_9HYPH|nr:head maturation protease, ClpP-related [Filomicrobium insigne]SDP40362.1 ATP-dependent protease ClpP, protease subunit [Filomicrobium insigne]